MPLAVTANMVALSAHHLYLVSIEFQQLGRGRADLMRDLADADIHTQVHDIPLYNIRTIKTGMASTHASFLVRNATTLAR